MRTPYARTCTVYAAAMDVPHQTHERPRDAADPLTREAIVEAALTLVDRESMEALTMRGLARELGRAPMSLYRHVGDHDGLIRLVMEQLTEAVDTPDHGEDWRRTLTEGLTTLRALFVRYPGIIQVGLSSGIRTEGMLQRLDIIVGALLRAGLTPAQAARAHRALFALAFGDAALERTVAAVTGAEDADQAFMADFGDHAAEAFPNLVCVAPMWEAMEPDGGFQFALARLLDGIAALGATR